MARSVRKSERVDTREEPQEQVPAPIRPPVISSASGSGCVWTLKMGETGGMAEFPLNHPHRCVQIFGQGPGAVEIQGSLDGENWATVDNTKGVALKGINFSQTNTIENIAQVCRYIRPVVSGGSELTEVSIGVMAG